jgi:hypothetical protein
VSGRMRELQSEHHLKSMGIQVSKGCHYFVKISNENVEIAPYLADILEGNRKIASWEKKLKYLLSLVSSLRQVIVRNK